MRQPDTYVGMKWDVTGGYLAKFSRLTHFIRTLLESKVACESTWFTEISQIVSQSFKKYQIIQR